MPLHDFECPSGHQFDAVVDAGTQTLWCNACGQIAQKVFLRAPAGYVSPDIHYTSPVSGKLIRTKQERIDDLAATGSIEYDPGLKQDQERNKRRSDEQLEKAVESSVDEFFATAPARKREKLEQELRAGVAVEVSRASPATTT